MKSWADHCSSDEESLDALPAQVEAQKLGEVAPPPSSSPPPASVELADADPLADESAASPPAVPAERTYDFPDKPPFTAFIGNLAYSLKEADDLKAEVYKCALDLLGQEINILGARIAFGRDGNHRGFGYLEVETLEQLKLLMELNNKEATISGRKVQLDTATGNQNKHRNSNQRRNPGDSKIDGSRFRGGKFGSRNRKDDDGPPPQRPSLKLAPRTKKPEESSDERQASSNIFGGAKARDAQAWEHRRMSGNPEDGNNSHKKGENNDRRRSSQGGRGGGSGRGGGRGGVNKTEGNSNNSTSNENGNIVKRGPRRQSKQQQNQISPEERAAAAAAKATAEAAAAPTTVAPKAPAAPTNKFALLMDSDSE